MEFAEIRPGLEEVYELVAQGSGIRFSFEAEDRQTHVNSYTFYLRYQGPLPISNTVKVDITVSEILVFPVEQLPVLRTYPEFEDVPEDRPISVYSLNEIATCSSRTILCVGRSPLSRRKRRAMVSPGAKQRVRKALAVWLMECSLGGGGGTAGLAREKPGFRRASRLMKEAAYAASSSSGNSSVSSASEEVF